MQSVHAAARVPSLLSQPPPSPSALPGLQLALLPEDDASHQQHELWLADAYARAGRYSEAVRQYRQLLAPEREAGAFPPEQRVDVLSRLADIQVRDMGCGAGPGDGRGRAAILAGLRLPLMVLMLLPPHLPLCAAQAGRGAGGAGDGGPHVGGGPAAGGPGSGHQPAGGRGPVGPHREHPAAGGAGGAGAG